MTFIGICSVFAALGAPAIWHLVFRHLRPGRVSYVPLRLLYSVLVIAVLASGAVSFTLASLYDNLLSNIAPMLYVLGLTYVVQASYRRRQLHLEFTDAFRAPDLPMRKTAWQVLDWMRRYAKLYREVQVVCACASGEVELQHGGKTVATIALVDGDADSLFHEIGVRTLGLYDWPKGSGTTMVTLAYLGDDRWELDDGCGPVSTRSKPAAV